MTKNVPISEDKRANEYLANERTFLAWIRTCVAIMSLGFVAAKFGVWLRQLSASMGHQASEAESAASLPIGLGMMGLGAVLAVLAMRRYHVVNREIESGEVKADRGLVGLVTVFIVLLAVAMIVYMVLTAEHL